MKSLAPDLPRYIEKPPFSDAQHSAQGVHRTTTLAVQDSYRVLGTRHAHSAFGSADLDLPEVTGCRRLKFDRRRRWINHQEPIADRWNTGTKSYSERFSARLPRAHSCVNEEGVPCGSRYSPSSLPSPLASACQR